MEDRFNRKRFRDFLEAIASNLDEGIATLIKSVSFDDFLRKLGYELVVNNDIDSIAKHENGYKFRSRTVLNQTDLGTGEEIILAHYAIAKQHRILAANEEAARWLNKMFYQVKNEA